MASNKTIAAVLGATLVVTVGGCAGGPTATEREFGDSVRQMIRAQVYDPSTLQTPSEEPVERTDGQLLERSLEAYRGDVGNRDAVNDTIVVGVGEGQQQ